MLRFVDLRCPSCDELDELGRAQLAEVERMVTGLWTGRPRAVRFEGEHRAEVWTVRRDGSLVVFRAGSAVALAWSYQGLDCVDGFDCDELADAAAAARTMTTHQVAWLAVP